MTAPYRKANYGKIIQRYALTVSLALLAPIVIISIGIIIITTSDRRLNAINIYNDRVSQWQSIVDEYRNATFYLNNVHMENREMLQNRYFPVSDSCDKPGDPSEGCLHAASVFHSYNYTISGDFLNFTITDDNHQPIISDSIPTKDILRLSKKTLNCLELPICIQICEKLNGEWDIYHNECVLTRYLHKTCYRISKIEGKYQLDKSGLIDSTNYGCYYSNSWKPYMYSDLNIGDHVAINIRYYLDPVISASDETRGCSDDKLEVEEDFNCFGSTKADQSKSGVLMLIIGVAIIFIEILVISILMAVYVHHHRRVNPKIQLSDSMENIFIPYSVDELVTMHSPHVDEIREWTESKKHLLS